MKKCLFALVLGTALSVCVPAQTRIRGGASFDRTVYDFGDICVSDGPVSCNYVVTNSGTSPLNILSVVTSCGCTNVKWTRESIEPGKKGVISATYKNDEGPVPFDKTLTVYLSCAKEPVILRLRGISREKVLPLEERYTVLYGDLALKSDGFPRLNLNQGQQKSGEITVANLGAKSITVRFTDLSEGLSLHLDNNPIPAHQTARLIYTITAGNDRWGLCEYSAVPVVNDVRQRGFFITAATKEDFSGLSGEEKAAGPNPTFEDNVLAFKSRRTSGKVQLEFKMGNVGKKTLHIHKADVDNAAATVGTISDVPAGGQSSFTVTVDTGALTEGENRVMITLTTNSPLRPVVNLFVTGFIN